MDAGDESSIHDPDERPRDVIPVGPRHNSTQSMIIVVTRAIGIFKNHFVFCPHRFLLTTWYFSDRE